MESKKINQLATELAPELSDLTIIGDPTTGISKKITLSQMASLFTGTVEEYANLASFPLVGTADTIYIALDTNIIYRWNTGTSAYVELSPNIVTSLVFNDANGFDGTISLVGSTATLTITTALTQGSVGFIGASGALTQDNSNFFWDNTNKRLGINTNAPTTAIDAFGSGIIGRLNGTSTNNAFLGFASAGSNKWSIGNVQSDHRFRIYSEANTAELVSVLQTGEVGIGIANPLTKLHIFGGASALIANLDANTSVAKSISFRSGNSSRINLEVSGTESGSNAGMNFYLRTYSDAGSLLNGNAFVLRRSTGYIGVGTDTPLAPIHINYDLGTSNAALRLTNGSAANASNISKIALFLANTFGGSEESAAIYAINPNASTNNGGHLVFGTSAYSTASIPTERMRLNNLGYLGLNTSSPSTLLHLSSTSTQLTLQNVDGGSNAERVGFFMNSNDTFKIISLNDNNTTRVDNIIVANVLNGNVGIGAVPTYTLDVQYGGDFNQRLRSNAAGGTVKLLLETANTFSGTSQAYIGVVGSAGGGQSSLIFGTAANSGDTSASERLRINSVGQVGIGTSSFTGFSASDLVLRVQQTSGISAVQAISGDSGAGVWLYSGASSTDFPSIIFKKDLRFGNTTDLGTNGYTERMRLTANGELYFNTNSTGYRVIIGGATGIRNIILTNADSEGYAGGTTGMYIGKNSSTNRSINAAGTINASGADYAEYMKKSKIDLDFSKGDIIGVDKNGLLTDIFSDSVSFVVKSTDPSYVGGDNWFNKEIAPEKSEDQTEEEFNKIYSEWDKKYQEARKWIDRIAFSGQVPCNVYNAKEGDYIIPINNNGKISGQSITNPTFEQYKISVGKVWKIMEDGRAWVAVKIG